MRNSARSTQELRLATAITPMPADRAEHALRSWAVMASLVGLALAIANYVL